MSATATRPRVIPRLLDSLWIVAMLAIIVVCGGIVVAEGAFGVTPMRVASGSMEPSIPAESLIFAEQVEPARIRTGDVITFDPPGDLPSVTHRVVGRTQVAGTWFFETKGDANATVDDWAGTAPTRGVTYGDGTALRHVGGVPHLGQLGKMRDHTTLRSVLVVGGLGGILVILALGLVARLRLSPRP